MLVDAVEVTFKAGKGGDGVVSWRREKHVPKGGPDGGDGGRGGSITLIASDNVDTLTSFQNRKIFQAEDGHNGEGKKKTGAAGDDLELLVPTGTILTNLATSKVIGDLLKVGDRMTIARGGRGGLGNVHFATPAHQNPFESTEGTLGEVKKLRLELRLIADIALIGEPNAGKSSLLVALTGVNSRVGAYPFSTVHPVLGVLHHGDKRVVLVDLPGLLEGAHQGKGLGDTFLQHAQRVRALVQVIDGTTDVKKSEQTILHELSQFDVKLAKLPRVIVINKVDLLTADELQQIRQLAPQAIVTSTVSQSGIAELKVAIVDLLS